MYIRIAMVAAWVFTAFAWAAATASDPKADIAVLFSKYDQVIHGHQTELAEQVFATSFIREEDGLVKFAEKIRSVRKSKVPPYELQIKLGIEDHNLAFVKRVENGKPSDSTYIVRRQPSGEWRIEGTISDLD
jgi:hypothetical protein